MARFCPKNTLIVLVKWVDDFFDVSMPPQKALLASDPLRALLLDTLTRHETVRCQDLLPVVQRSCSCARVSVFANGRCVRVSVRLRQ